MAVGAKHYLGGTRMVGTNKSLGQHWLKNRQILDEIADLAVFGSAFESSAKTPKLCLEIGPGLGTLTSSLLKRFEKVVAIEFDSRLAQNLPKSFPGKNLEVINEDILKFDFNEIKEPYVVVGNIPYYITSPIIEKILTQSKLPNRIVLLIQKEVADRIVSDSETKLSLFVKNRANVELGPFVGRNEFTPPPKVDSEILVLEPHAPIISKEVFDLIDLGFLAPRKKLIHNLSKLQSKEALKTLLDKCHVSPDARPGDLNLGDWQKLYSALRRTD